MQEMRAGREAGGKRTELYRPLGTGSQYEVVKAYDASECTAKPSELSRRHIPHYIVSVTAAQIPGLNPNLANNPRPLGDIKYVINRRPVSG